jgi:hypothetical protein
MLTDHQIIELGKRMSIPLEGVYFKDELPDKLKTNKTYIINLQDSEDEQGNENSGTHWTLLQIHENDKEKQPFYFDPYGVEPPEILKKRIKKDFNLYLPYNNKDIQSLMNNACGFYCLALAHFVNASQYRTNNFYNDIDEFLEMFDDLNKSIDWKKNEYILKMFFVAKDKNRRKDIDVLNYSHDDYERIINEDEGGGIDLMKIPVDVNMMKK